MEFLVQFQLDIPSAAPEAEVEQRRRAEAVAAAELASEGHLVRLWRRSLVGDGNTAVGLYRAESTAELDGLLANLPLADWMGITVMPLEAHPNDPPAAPG